MFVVSAIGVFEGQSTCHVLHSSDGEVQTDLFTLPEKAGSGVMSIITGKRFLKGVEADGFALVKSGETSQNNTNGYRKYDRATYAGDYQTSCFLSFDLCHGFEPCKRLLFLTFPAIMLI